MDLKPGRGYMNTDVTLEEARRKFAELDAALCSGNAGTELRVEDGGISSIILKFIDAAYRVEHPSGRVFTAEGEEASTYVSIIILHYLVSADGTPLSGKWISYRHLPGGDIYTLPFRNRAIMPFLGTFGTRPDSFIKAAASLGGFDPQIGGTAMALQVLPRVPLCFVLWPGDDELAPSANILFDEAAPHYLPTEDYAHLPGLVNSALKKLAD